MKSISIKLSSEIKSLEIHTFADLHIGDKACDKKLIQEKLDYVKNTPNAYCILNGDIMNWASKASVSDCYAEEYTPMEQIKIATDMFYPIANKILCMCSGNHEARAYRSEGIDITQIVARQLCIEDRYAREGGLIFLRFGKESRNRKKTGDSNEMRQVCYTIYTTHGSGGGRKEGAKAIRLADMASIIDTDIYIHSHTHLPMIMKQAFYRIDKYNSTFACVDKLFVNTSATLDYGGYGQSFEFKPSSKDCPIIYLNGTKKEFTARL